MTAQQHIFKREGNSARTQGVTVTVATTNRNSCSA